MNAWLPQHLAGEWKALCQREMSKPYFQQLANFLAARETAGATIFPPKADWFNAFVHTPYAEVKVVILGQDPYHGAGQAHGLSFSVPAETPLPPSLRNIYKELSADLSIAMPSTGNLTPWAQQGVLLLNAVLTVEEKQAGSHAKQGWEIFTDNVIAHLAEHKQGLVFVLWGAYAQQKAKHIDLSSHKVIAAPHPSPLSAHRGFFGTRPFSQINEYFVAQGREAIDWHLP